MLIFQKAEMKLKRMVIVKTMTLKIPMTPGIKILLEEVEIVKFILTPTTKQQLTAIVIKKKLLLKLLMVR